MTMEVAATPSTLASVNQNGATPPIPPWPVTPSSASSGSAALMAMATPPGFLSHYIAPNQSYPAPLAKHLELVASKELFLDTLKKFHIALGTRLVIPKMGGKDLDLHVLYVEVTQRGGLQQVIKDRKWKEITGAFNFPRTTTSASFVLRKYYITLLHHYEQLYFFGSSGRLITAPTPLPAPSPLPVKQMEHVAPPVEAPTHAEKPEVINTEGKKVFRKRKLAPMPTIAPVNSVSSVGDVVTGEIEGKFEHGYLVTVMVGTERLQGVIYHIPPDPAHGPQFAHVPNFSPSPDVLKLPETIVPARERKRKQREELKKDPNAPRSSRTGYNFFFAEERAKLKLLYPDKERELSRMIGDNWNSLTEEQKTPYQERGAKDKERYEKEMREYKQLKLSFQAGLGNAPRLQEVHPEAAGVATSSAVDSDHHVATVESNSKPPSVPVIPPPFYLGQSPQTQQLVKSSQSASEQPSTQQYLQHFANSLQRNMGTPLYAAQSEQHSHLGHGNVSSEVTQGSCSQPVAHQFMD